MSKLLCIRCRGEFEPDDSLTACPDCGSTNPPADTADRVAVTLTWHELRILVIWAERWASQCEEKTPGMLRTVYGIAGALTAQHLTKGSLTFLGEVSDLRGQGLNIQQNVVREDPLK